MVTCCAKLYATCSAWGFSNNSYTRAHSWHVRLRFQDGRSPRQPTRIGMSIYTSRWIYYCHEPQHYGENSQVVKLQRKVSQHVHRVRNGKFNYYGTHSVKSFSLVQVLVFVYMTSLRTTALNLSTYCPEWCMAATFSAGSCSVQTLVSVTRD